MSYIIDKYRTLRDEYLYYTKSKEQITFFILTSVYIAFFYTLFKEQQPNIWYFIFLGLITLFIDSFYLNRHYHQENIMDYIGTNIENRMNELTWHTKGIKIGISKFEL